MLLLRTEALPQGDKWQYELKLDGYRAIAFKSEGRVFLRSRNDNDFNSKYPAVAASLHALPGETVIDGELIAFDESGRPSFNALQNFGTTTAPVAYYVFDVLILAGRNVMLEPLNARRKLLEKKILPRLSEPIRYYPPLDGKLDDLIETVRSYQFEGLVAKDLTSVYEPGLRSGAWRKMRINRGQEFVIGGYTTGGTTFDALIFGYYEGKQLLYAARTRNGFTPHSREQLLKKLRPLETTKCPFANLSERHAGRWGQGLTAEKIKDCVWVKPLLVGQFEFTEWTPENHLRHSRFVALREDKKAHDVNARASRRKAT